MRRPLAFQLSLLVLTGCNAFEMNTQAPEIRIDCKINSDALSKGSVILDCIAHNIGDQSVRLLPWNTPLESKLRGRFLEVKNSKGEELDYRGLMVKRAAPTEQDYLTLEVGKTITSSLDLTISYSFCPDTSYQINYSSSQSYGSSSSIKLRMPSVDFSTNGVFPTCEPTT